MAIKKRLSWKTRIARAKKFGFTTQDSNDAGTWRFCAVGERLEIKREPDNYDITKRIGKEAVELGIAFYESIILDSRLTSMVERIYNRIQILPKRNKESKS